MVVPSGLNNADVTGSGDNVTGAVIGDFIGLEGRSFSDNVDVSAGGDDFLTANSLFDLIGAEMDLRTPTHRFRVFLGGRP